MMKLDQAWMKRECVGPFGEQEWIAIWAMAAPGVMAAKTIPEAIDAFGAAMLRFHAVNAVLYQQGGAVFGTGLGEVRVIQHDNDHHRWYWGVGPSRLQELRQPK